MANGKCNLNIYKLIEKLYATAKATELDEVLLLDGMFCFLISNRVEC